MVGCAAFGCSNRAEKGFRMYGFPKDVERRKRWMAMVNRQNLCLTEDGKTAENSVMYTLKTTNLLATNQEEI
ncbi:DNA transposase THAP9 [Dissostichus eleginoides]|uniref:DNA transposase THAP9 n=1 Tax=Dissostichus eleginoides TaxID=100907 RepID=A0AAD9CL42_DISEL|nr:DNA transposase THAP9 [Dissostichus eleginoides]